LRHSVVQFFGESRPWELPPVTAGIGVRLDGVQFGRGRAEPSMRLVRLPGPPGTTKIYEVGPLWAPKFLERKFAVF